MKRKIIVLLAAVCALSLAGGCGTKQKENGKQQEDNKQEEDGKQGEDGSLVSKSEIDYKVEDCVELGQYMGLDIVLGTYKVTDDEVKDEIRKMLISHPVYEETDKTTVEEGDFANIDYEGLKDGVAFEGGAAQGTNLEIGSNSFIEGFEEGLIGKKVGEKVALDLTFPENYQNEELAGQAVVFNVTINKIVNQVVLTYDDMTDEYVKENFTAEGYNNIKELKKGVKEDLNDNKELQKENDIKRELFVKLQENCKVELPEGLLDAKLSEYIEQFNVSLEYSGMEMKDYLASTNSTQEEFDEQVKQTVEDSLKNQLIMEAISKAEKIEADQEGYAAYKENVVTNYGYESEEALIEQYGEAYVRDAYISDKTLELLLDSVKVTYDAKMDAAEDEQSQEK